MSRRYQRIKAFGQEESGQDLIEYALIAGFLGLGAIATLRTLANSLTNTMNAVGNALTNSL